MDPQRRGSSRAGSSASRAPGRGERGAAGPDRADEAASPATSLPPPLGVLDEERARIVRILDRLDELTASALTERADLAHQLVRAASRYRDAMERAVLPAVGNAAAVRFLRSDDPSQARLVAAMEVVQRRTRHIDPRNAHAGDAQGLEDAISDVVDGLRDRLRLEDERLPAVLGTLSDDAREELSRAAAAAVRHASEQVRSPRTALGRAMRNLAIRLDDTVEDVATPTHPGADVVERGPQDERP